MSGGQQTSSTAITNIAPMPTTRFDLETSESRGFVKEMLSELEHRERIRARQEEIIADMEDRLAHERAKLRDQVAVIDTLSSLINELENCRKAG